MTTTSANIAGTVRPFMMLRRDMPCPCRSNKVWSIDEIKPSTKKPKKKELLGYGQIGMIKIESVKGDLGESKITVPVGRKEDGLWKHIKSGKVGVWRTVMGRRTFFPSDGSAPIPKIRDGKAVKGTEQGPSLYKPAGAEKKKSIFDRIKGWAASKLGGGGGASASLKDVKPKAEKKAKVAEKKPESKTGGSEKGKSEKKEKEIPNRKKLLDQVEDMILQATRAKRSVKIVRALTKMQAALKSNDADAFRKAEAGLAGATAVLQRSVKKKTGR